MNAAPAGPGRLREAGRFLEIQNLGLNLPFALAFLLIASNGLPSVRTLVLVVIAFVAARNAGHSFNRYADRSFDARNPRTSARALVTGRISPGTALTVTAAMSAIVVACAYLLNPLALVLSPVALALILGYSYTKRWTAGTTAVLGVVEAVTPAAAFVAAQGALPPAALLASLAFFLWGTAFETIHSLGDVESDRALGLKSLPLALGDRASVRLVAVLHGLALAALVAVGLLSHLSIPYFGGLWAMLVVAMYTDALVARDPRSSKRPFQLHFAQGALFLAATAGALFLGGPPVTL